MDGLFQPLTYVFSDGITEADAMYLAQNDVQIVEEELLRAHPCVEELDAVRQLVLVDMAFNMGVPRLCKFKKMWNAIHENKFDIAAKEMLDSRWANQVKSRSTKLANAMHNACGRTMRESLMARQLTGKQQAFLNVLFDEAGGNMVTAKKMAGYSDTTTTSRDCKRFERRNP